MSKSYLLDSITDDELTANVLAVFRSASPDNVSAGSSWYSAAHTYCLGAARRHSVLERQAHGIVAALSPGTEWSRNLLLAEEFLATGDCAHHYGQGRYGNGPITKARAILAGATFDEVCAGPARKTKAFYACILRPATATAVCIDRHAHDIAVGQSADDTERMVLDRDGAYDRIADAYVRAAEQLGLRPHVVQAVTWLAWKEQKTYERPQHTALYGGKVA